MDSLFFKEYYVKISIFSQLPWPVPKASVQLEFIWVGSNTGHSALFLAISPSSKLRITYRFLWIPCSLRDILSKFEFLSQPARLVGNRFNRFVGPTCIEHWFWWFWSPNPTWLGPISSRYILGNILDPFWALIRVSCNPPWIHMNSWWWSKGVNVKRAAHLVDCEECLGSWFPRLMGALSRAVGGKNKGGSGKSRGSGIKKP